jgi:hypothetical protein
MHTHKIQVRLVNNIFSLIFSNEFSMKMLKRNIISFLVPRLIIFK